MYSMSDLTSEIEQVVEGLEHMAAPRLDRDWITQAVMAKHPDVEGADADFYACVSREKVRDAVRQRLNRYKAKAEVFPDPQLVLSGFERLQRYYSIEEDGQHDTVRVQDMSPAQLRKKATELYAMGVGCNQHGDELMRFADEQERMRAAA
jgi:hypothetical protein